MGPIKDDDIWICTDAVGTVLSCSPAAVQLLGYSARGVRGRTLLTMFVRNRPGIHELVDAAQGHTLERHAQFRPNDRKALDVRYRIAPADDGVLPPGTLRWTFQVTWPMALRLPRGVDRRQLITVWRAGGVRCVFVPAGAEKRRLFVCGSNDSVLHEEAAIADVASAFARAAELRRDLARFEPADAAP